MGPVETAYKAWLDSLGATLSLRQQAAKAQILSLAREIDDAPGERLSAKASASRELRAVALELRDAGAVGAPADDADAAETTPPSALPDGVADIGEAARRRREAGG